MSIDWGQAVISVGGPLVVFYLGTVLYGTIKARRSAKAQVPADEREARRDTIEDRDALLDRVLTRLGDVEQRMGQLERTVRRYSDHIDVLENHIWKGLPPPPPARPTDH